MKFNLKELLNDTNQLTRITVLTAVVLVLAMLSFGGYYYYDRYYSNQPEQAKLTLAEAEQAVRDAPQDPDKRLALAESYMLNSRFKEAITQANQVLTVKPDSQHAWLVVGVSSDMLGQPTDAIEPLSKFVEARKDEENPGLDKQLQSAAYYLGDSYLQLGKAQDAIGPLEMAVNWSRTDADAMYKLALAYSSVKEYEKAVNMLQGATSFVPDFLEAYDAMATAYDALQKPVLASYARGMIAYSKKDYKGALPILLQAAQADPGYPPVFTGLGRTYEALDDLPNAKAAYEAAFKLDPNNFTASNGIERVDAALKK